MGIQSRYEFTEVPDTFYDEARENAVLVAEPHVMDERPAERLDYIHELTQDLNRALDTYNSDTLIVDGDTGSSDHIGAILDGTDAERVIFLTGDEDRKVDRERNFIGWANMLEPGSDHFSTDVDYSLNGEHIRLDKEIELPGNYPVHIQHFPEDCPESEDELGFQTAWFSEPSLYDLFKYDRSHTMDKVVQAAFHGHTHGYDARQVGLTGLVSLGGLRNNYVTNGNLPENSIQAVSFGKNDFEVVHESRAGELQESQKFRQTKEGFKLVKSRGKDRLTPLERYEKNELPPGYLRHLQQGPNRKKANL